jgi:epoxyqueuosine reductase QueG
MPLSCPSGAIPKGGRVVIRGIRRWNVDDNKCRRFWDHVGGSCGVCQAVCPWSHPDNLFHATVRELAEGAPFLRRLLIWGEKVTYGRFKAARPPEWVTLLGRK